MPVREREHGAVRGHRMAHGALSSAAEKHLRLRRVRANLQNGTTRSIRLKLSEARVVAVVKNRPAKASGRDRPRDAKRGIRSRGIDFDDLDRHRIVSAGTLGDGLPSRCAEAHTARSRAWVVAVEHEGRNAGPCILHDHADVVPRGRGTAKLKRRSLESARKHGAIVGVQEREGCIRWQRRRAARRCEHGRIEACFCGRIDGVFTVPRDESQVERALPHAVQDLGEHAYLPRDVARERELPGRVDGPCRGRIDIPKHSGERRRRPVFRRGKVQRLSCVSRIERALAKSRRRRRGAVVRRLDMHVEDPCRPYRRPRILRRERCVDARVRCCITDRFDEGGPATAAAA